MENNEKTNLSENNKHKDKVDAQKHLEVFLDANPDLMFVVDKNHRIINYRAPREEELFAPPFFFMGKTIGEVLPPELAINMGEKLNAVLKTGQASSLIYSLEIKGETHHFEARQLPCGNEEVLSIVRDITERKTAEEKLRQSEAEYKHMQGLFRMMADIIPDMLWAKDVNKNYIFANKSICENLLNAKDTNEPIGKNDMFFAERERASNPDNPEWHTFGEICRDSDSIVLETGQTGQFDEFGNVKGRFLYLDVVKTPLRNEAGEIIGVVGTARDVTNSKRAEKQLKDSEARLSLAVKVANMGYWQYEVETNKVDWSADHDLLFGITDKSFGGTLDAVLSYVHPDDRLHSKNNLMEATEMDKPYINNYRVVHHDGKVRWLYSYGELIKDENNKLVSIFGITRDITEQRLAEENLLLQTRFRELLMEISARFINIPLEKVDEAVNDSLRMMGLFVQADRAYTFDYDWQARECNNTYEWCGQGISAEIDNLQHIPFDMMPAWIETHSKGKAIDIPDVFALPPGFERELLEPQGIKSVLSVPMMNQDECIGFVGFDSVHKHHYYTDIEKQLLKVYAQLLVNIKLRIQTEKELVEAKNKAVAGDLLKTAFIQNISHEIRTPLNHIIGFSGMMVEQDSTQEERESYFQHLEEGSNRLLDTISDYMDIALIVSGNLRINKRKILVDEILVKVYHHFKAMYESKGLILELLPAESKPFEIVTDPELLRKLLAQFIDNALKFTKTGGASFGYTVHAEKLVFFVRDTGKGIAADKLKSVFEPFVQEDTAITRGYEGSGLGLSNAKGIAEALEGHIHIESSPGVGTHIRFEMPLVSASETAGSVTVSQEETSKSDKRTILIAEDDVLGYSYLKTVIAKAGFTCVHAKNGEEAVSLARSNNQLTLVLMDLKMPVLDGIEASKQIREFNKTIPIIALTAYTKTGDEHKAIEAGCNDYLAKPVGKDELLGRIRLYVAPDKMNN